MSYLSSLANVEISEVAKLRAENQSLAEELAQCQADKEFVWSLWKRLQVANPDITQAVGIVVQREREKSELKDRKVLEILQSKDDKLDYLQRDLDQITKQLAQTITRKTELEDVVSPLEKDNAKMKEKLLLLENIDKNRDSITKQSRQDVDRENTDLQKELGYLKRDKEDLMKDKADLQVIRDTQKERIQNLERELEELSTENRTMSAELKEVKTKVEDYEDELSRQAKELNTKMTELNKARIELEDLWSTHSQTSDCATQQAGLIRQLQAVNKDTQKMLQNQEEAFSLETASIHNTHRDLQIQCQSLKSTEAHLRREVHSQQQKLNEQERVIADLNRQLDNTSTSTQATIDKEVQVHDMQSDEVDNLHSEVDLLRGRLKEKNRMLLSMSGGKRHRSSTPTRPGPRARSASPRSAPGRIASLHTGSTRAGSPRPTSPHSSSRGKDKKRLRDAERKLDEARTFLKIKVDELEEVRSAHDKRLGRLQALQKNYRLLKKEFKILEEEQKGPGRKRKKIPRADPKSLQHEDSDSVWNELAFYRKENKNLKLENMNLQEEADTLRVQTAQDAATIHELTVCLEQEREELQFVEEQHKLEKARLVDPDLQHTATRHQIEEMERQFLTTREEKGLILQERDTLYTETKTLKGEINRLKHENAKYKIEVSNSKREQSKLTRDLKREIQKHKDGHRSRVRQYQRSLNQSIDKMSGIFNEFNQDGWEDTVESVDLTEPNNTTATETTGTSESLGQAIAHHASMMSEPAGAREHSPRKSKPTCRQVESIEDHITRMYRKDESPTRDQGRRMVNVAVSSIRHALAHKPPAVVVKKPLMSHPTMRQTTVLRQRITTLQKQVSVLKSLRDSGSHTQAQQRQLIKQLQSELNLAQGRLTNHRITIQRLNAEIERLNEDKEVLQDNLNMSSHTNTTDVIQADENISNLQSRLRISAAEVSRQLNQIKDLKIDKEENLAKIQQLQDRLNHQERDLGQKRTLIDEMRLKLKVAQDNAKADSDVLGEVEDKLRALAESNNRYKVQIDSLKQRLKVAGKERQEDREKVLRLSGEIEKKSKLVNENQRKNADLRASLEAVENAAKQQLQALAEQSEQAIDAAQAKFTQVSNRLCEYNKFVKGVPRAIVNSLIQARQQLYQQEARKARLQAGSSVPSSLARAQGVAASILNLSQEDLEDIMSLKTAQAEEYDAKLEDGKKDKIWQKRWEKILHTKQEFSLDLVDLLMEKMEERCALATELTVL